MVVEFSQSLTCRNCPDSGCEVCPIGQVIYNVERFQSEIPLEIVDEVHEFMNRYNWMGV